MEDERNLINGQWRIGKNIGSGGFASVSLAVNVQSSILAAVKIEDKRISELLPSESIILQNLCDAGRFYSW